MKKVIISFILGCLVISCQEKEEQGGEIERNFYLNTELSKSDNVGVFPNWTNGEKTVFRFQFRHPDEPNIADDELTEQFWIEVPADLSSFSIDAPITEESNLETYYTRACYCYLPEGFDFTHLKVEAKREAYDRWSISFELKVEGTYGDYELKDTGIYTLDTFNY